MNLGQMFDLAHRKSYYSRADVEVWQAISNAQVALYLKVLKEYRAFWVVFDTSSVSLVPNTEEYSLPATCGQLLRMRERTGVTVPWQMMNPADINDPAFQDAQYYAVSGGGIDDPISAFLYYGPYLDQTDAITSAQIQKIRVEPVPVDTRLVELAFVAKPTEVTGSASPLIMPLEGHNCMLYAAVASLLADNGDDPTVAKAHQAEDETYFLNWVRQRQMQSDVVSVRPFIQDLD